MPQMWPFPQTLSLFLAITLMVLLISLNVNPIMCNMHYSSSSFTLSLPW